MNALFLFAVFLLFVFTLLGAYIYLQDRRERAEIAEKAKRSDIDADEWDD